MIEKQSGLLAKNKKLQKRFKALKTLIGKQKVILYGADAFAQTLLDHFDFSAFNITGICDRNFTDKTHKYKEYPAVTYCDLLKTDFEVILLLTENETAARKFLNFIINYKGAENITLIPFYKKTLQDRIEEFYNTSIKPGAITRGFIRELK